MVEEINIEKFIAGCEEIDRKRKIITRVFKSVFKLIENSGVERKDDDEQIIHRICKVPDGAIFYRQCTFIIGQFSGKLNAYIQIYDNHTITVDDGDFVPFEMVPVVYSLLLSVINELSAKYPDVGIIENFKFFMDQAPK